MTPTKPQKLEDQAATAALYVTKGTPDKSKSKPNNYPLDADNKLSSAGAAASLKHADPRDLPAYPVVGLPDPDSSAGAAASLANKNKKAFEHWKPGDIPAANKAALHAKDYKMAPLWQSELSAASSKAALLADKEGGDVKIWKPEETDVGHSAAGQAMRRKGLIPQLDYGHTDEGGRRAMMAASQSMASGRKRAGSTPIEPSPLYPDSKNSATNALKAATSVTRSSARPQAPPGPSVGPTIDAAKIHNAAVTNLSREMYTSNPPVAPETEEKNRQAGLRASAIAMAQKMYNVQQRAIEEAAADTRAAEGRYGAAHALNRPSSISSEESHHPPQYVNLQEAAQKLAAERLAKLHDEHAAYRQYYGAEAPPQSRKLSVRRPGRRASSGGEEDEERSGQIRNQMSLFTDKLARVDNKKRQKDRESLLAAAQRNVRASMTAQDERVFNETGKVSPAMMAEWEAKAKAKAEAESGARMVNHGKVNIGGGRYMDQSEIDAIATAKVQPTLDEVSATAEKQRARDEELRQQQLERERIQAEKETDQRERDAKTKAEWKRFKEQEKREARARKEEERMRKVEERRLRDEERRKAREEKVLPKASKEDSAVENVAKEAEPPVLEPIPHVASIAPVELKKELLPGDEERLEPTFIPQTELEEITASQASLAPVASEDSDLERVYTAESSVGHLSGNAEDIAKRVFAAPTVGEGIPLNQDTAPKRSESQQIANNTSNVEEAPVVKAEMVTTTTTTTTDNPPISTAIEPISANIESSPQKAPDAPTSARIAPSIPMATTETTVTGPLSSSKSKDAKGVSSWLKTKFRRASKPSKPETSIPANDTKEKGFVGGASLTAPGTSQDSSDQGDSMREVAMAGKDPASARTAVAGIEATPVVSPQDEEDLYSTSPHDPTSHPTAAASALHRESTSSPSISSLSSDEDTRGRSAIPREREPMTQAEFIRAELKRGEHVDPHLIAGEQINPATIPAKASTAAAAPPPPRHHLEGKETESSVSSSGERGDVEGEEEEYEEAKDTFDSERLSPPAKGIVGGERKSDSPARDSKFLEDL